MYENQLLRAEVIDLGEQLAEAQQLVNQLLVILRRRRRRRRRWQPAGAATTAADGAVRPPDETNQS